MEKIILLSLNPMCMYTYLYNIVINSLSNHHTRRKQVKDIVVKILIFYI